ncbi:MAG: 1-acyl-sn-glycerol-3-phosphate acyltransferase [Pseudomonadaceae bacterium]|nr:1-acyl-sn-glycerol-3-phosphate acyltransferase [Pseudomonadaceae bacterium]
MLTRKLITVPALLATTAIVTALSPGLLLIALLASLRKKTQGAFRTTLFGLLYLWSESIGVLVAAVLWLAQPVLSDYQQANRRLQKWWAATLHNGGAAIFNVSFQIENPAALDGPPAVVIPRHTSIADTVLPMTLYSHVKNVPLRYVMKQELLWDPCLDIVGHRLPNFFIDRSGVDTETELSELGKFVSQLPEDEGLVFYPEGTRFSADKRERILARRHGTPDADLLASWPDLLPPRRGGTLTVLDSNPGHDLLFCCHVGFEGAAGFSDLVSGAWTHAKVKVAFWRIPFTQWQNAENGKTFVNGQWDAMQAMVRKLST